MCMLYMYIYIHIHTYLIYVIHIFYSVQQRPNLPQTRRGLPALVNSYICVSIHMFTDACVYVHIYVYIHIFMCMLHMYIHIYPYIHTFYVNVYFISHSVQQHPNLAQTRGGLPAT
jgi:hypothetical protein